MATSGATDSGRTGRRRRPLAVGAAAVVVAALVVGAIAWQPWTDEDDPYGNTVGGDPMGTWQQVADAPLAPRAEALLVWTGEEVLVIGGTTDPPCPPNASCLEGTRPRRDGAAYDPAADTWRPIADAPVGLRSGARAAAAAGRAYVPDPDDDRRILRYDPAEDRWDAIDAPPSMSLRELSSDGDQLYAGLTTTIGGIGDDVVDVVLDTATDRWEPLPPDPLRGEAVRHLVVADGQAHVFAEGFGADRLRAAVLEDDGWRELPEARNDGYLPTVAADGLVVSPLDEETAGDRDDVPGHWAFDTEADAWTEVPEVPHADGPSVAGSWIGGADVILVGEVVLDVEARTWAPLGAPDELERQGLGAVWAGDRLVTFGGAVIPDDGRGPWSEAELQADAWTWAP